MKKIFFFGLLSFLIAAIWQLPLSVAKPYAEKYIKGLTMKNVSGTVWHGAADYFSVNNTNLGHVDWQVKPIKSIGSASITSLFTIKGSQLTANGLASITPAKKIILENTRFDLDASYLNKIQKNATLAGDINGHIKHAEIDQKKLPAITAKINWKDGAVNSPIRLAPGDYLADIKPNKDGLLIQLSSSDAPADLNGQIKLNKDWLYDANITIKAKDKNIAPMLGFLGKKQADGSIIIKQNGDLKPFIAK